MHGVGNPQSHLEILFKPGISIRCISRADKAQPYGLIRTKTTPSGSHGGPRWVVRLPPRMESPAAYSVIVSHCIATKQTLDTGFHFESEKMGSSC